MLSHLVWGACGVVRDVPDGDAAAAHFGNDLGGMGNGGLAAIDHPVEVEEHGVIEVA
jgi:hypothetical protein